MMTAVLIDDEPASLAALKLKIEKASDDVTVLKSFSSALLAMEQLEKLSPDVVFLDVEMPEMDGFSFMNQYADRPFEVIITTAHDEYAVQAIRQSALDFLLKPISNSDLTQSLDRLTQKVNAKKKAEKSTYNKLNALYDKIPIPSVRGITFVAFGRFCT